MTAEQAKGFVARVRALVLGDPMKRGEEFWGESIGLRGWQLTRVLLEYREKFQ